MTETTVTVGDTEVQIAETEDGFEATPVEEEPEGTYLRFESSGSHGCEIPIDADFAVEHNDYNRHRATDSSKNHLRVAWYEEDDISDLKSDGAGTPLRKDGYDWSAAVSTVEVVHY